MSTIKKATMMDIPLDANVECADGPGGRSSYVIIDPTTERVTHFVVKGNGFRRTERLVSVDWIVETSPDLIRLRCTKDKLVTRELFIGTGHIQIKRSRYDQAWHGLSSRIVPRETVMVPTKYKRIPPGELAVHQGARVQATDGRVGRVDGFLVEPETGRISHLVLREGHLWSQKNVAIPISQINRVGEETVYLKLDKRSIESLPYVPIRWPTAAARPSS